MPNSCEALESRVWKTADAFRSGRHGQSQTAAIAATLEEGSDNVKVVGLLLAEIHRDGRELLAKACPCAVCPKRR